MTNCSVYVVHSTSGHCKIGISEQPKKRIKALQATQGPFEYELIHYWVCGSRKEAAFIERYLHNIFSSCRVNGEWFTLSPADLIFLGGDGIEMARHEYEHGR